MINHLKKSLWAVLLISFFVFAPVLIFAQPVGAPVGQTVGAPAGQTVGAPVDTGKIVNPISASTLEGLIKTVLEGVIKIGIPIIALAIIYCGFLFVSARGNSEAIKKAKDALIYTLIGAAVLLGAWAIAQLISNTVLAL